MMILLQAVVAGAYWLLAWWAWRASAPQAGRVHGLGQGAVAPLFGQSGSSFSGAGGALMPNLGMPERLLLLGVWLLHALVLGNEVDADGQVRFGFALVLSTTIWLTVAVFWVESLFYSLAGIRILLLPFAGAFVLLPLWFPGSTELAARATVPSSGHSVFGNPAFGAHLVVALSAYGLLTIAALHALAMTALDRWLHQRHYVEAGDATANTGWFGRWLARFESAVLGQLPPLMTMESLLFHLLSAGFVLLTLTVLTGAFFSETLFGRAWRFEHKTVFTLISWVIFAALLAGRQVYGWRGRVALRWTLAGFLSMLLAYVGSRFVLEVVLNRV